MSFLKATPPFIRTSAQECAQTVARIAAPAIARELAQVFAQVSARIPARVSALVLLVFCAILPAQAQTLASILDELPVPPGAIARLVSDQSVINGVPAAMATLESEASVDAVIAFYRKTWLPTENDSGYVESDIDGWRMISRLQGKHNIVIQLHDRPSAASGFISVIEVNPTAARARWQSTDRGIFSGLQRLSQHQSSDARDTSTVSVYASPTSVSDTHRIYRQKLISDGWRITADTEASGSHVIMMSRDQSRLELSVVESTDYGSMVVVNKVTSR